MKKLLLLGFISLLTISCKTSFRISVKEPATVNLPNDVTQFGIINTVNKQNSPEQKIAGVILGTSQINGNIEAADRAVEGALRSFERSNSIGGKSIPQIKNIYTADGSVNWVLMDSIAKKEGLDGFIELSKMETITPVGGSLLANATGQTELRLDGSMYVNTYIIEDRIAITQYKVSHSYTIPTSGSTSIVNILNDAQRKTEYFKALGFQLGHKAAALLYPNWVWVNREFYNKGSSVLKRAKPMITKGNWEIAEEQLLMGLDDRSEKVLGRITYNLALVKEGQGDIDEAIRYAKESALKYGDKMANEYLQTLQRRKVKLGL
ncbi:MAG TPA: DUF6340 family protein [Brumimicrobium sp.]|nr:DUF6340 family protein [Brumimicrobium sp.]